LLIKVQTDSRFTSAVEALLDASYREGCFQTRQGGKHRWLIDCRQGLSRSELLRPIVTALATELVDLEACQVVGYGVGSCFLIGGLIMGGHITFRGGILRTERKKYGSNRELEGYLCKGQQLVIVDDILNSGHTATRVLARLRALGFENIAYLSIFCFEWGQGVARLENEGVPVRFLARVSSRARNLDCENSYNLKKTGGLYRVFSQWLRRLKK